MVSGFRDRGRQVFGGLGSAFWGTVRVDFEAVYSAYNMALC